MDFLKSFDLDLYNLYLAIQEDMGTHPLYAVSKAQLFVGKLHDKIPHESEAFLEYFEVDLNWLMGLRGHVTFDEALKAHEMLYRMACWAVQKKEPQTEALPLYLPPHQMDGHGLSEAEVNAIIEKKVLVTMCGIIKEMDTIMSVLDDIEHKLEDYEGADARLQSLEIEFARLKEEWPSFKGRLKSLPRTTPIEGV
ncbi:MAG: hypothetical protein FWF59_07505 [Turicibacter sp.]|nr:hypothetical protein [Turicibacter sp.]